MTIGQLKELIAHEDDSLEVGIAVETPGGYVCPDGCLVDVKMATRGIDWHNFDFILVPQCQLKMTDKGFEDWRMHK